MKQMPHIFLLNLFFTAVFIFYYSQYYNFSTNDLRGSGDFILNFSQTVDSAERFLRGDFELFWNLGEFYPFVGSKAFSDHQILPGLILTIFYKLGLGFSSGFFLYLCLCYIATGSFCYLLLRELNISKEVSFLGAVLFNISQFKTVHFAHTQLAVTFYYPMLLLFMIQYFKKPSIQSGCGLIASVTALGLSSPYLFVFSIPWIVFCLPFLLVKELQSFSIFRTFSLVLIASVCILGLWKVYHPYELAHNLFGMSRDHGERALYSFKLKGFLSSSGLESPLWFTYKDGINVESMAYLPSVFWGLALLVILLIRKISTPTYKKVIPLTFMASVYLLISTGPTHILGVFVWDFLSKIPGFSGIRSPGRMVLWTQFLMIISVCICVNPFFKSLTKKFSKTLTLILVLITLVEVKPYQRELKTAPFKKYITLTNEMKKNNSEYGLKTPSVYYPFYDFESVHLLSASQEYHFVNGASGFTPVSSEHLLFPQLHECSSENCLYILKKIGVQLIVLNTHETDIKTTEYIKKSMQTKLLHQDEVFQTYQILSSHPKKMYPSDKSFVRHHGIDLKAFECSQNEVTDAEMFSTHFSQSVHSSPWSSQQKQQSGQGLILKFNGRDEDFKILLSHYQKRPSNTSESEYLKSFDFLRQFKLIDEDQNHLSFTTDISYTEPYLHQMIHVKPTKGIKQISILAKESKWVDNHWKVDKINICHQNSSLANLR